MEVWFFILISLLIVYVLSLRMDILSMKDELKLQNELLDVTAIHVDNLEKEIEVFKGVKWDKKNT